MENTQCGLCKWFYFDDQCIKTGFGNCYCFNDIPEKHFDDSGCIDFELGRKPCDKCHEIKPIEEFHLVRVKGKSNNKLYTYRRNTCKECWRIQEANRFFARHGKYPDRRRY